MWIRQTHPSPSSRSVAFDVDIGRRRIARNLAALGVLALTLGHGVTAAQSAPPGEARAPALPATGTVLQLPDLTLFDGSIFGPRQAQGQVLVLYWWASWCPFCALQSPEIQRLWQTQKHKGLQLLTLSVDRKREDATAYLQRKGFTFPAALVTPDIARVLPKPKGLPVTVVRGRDGTVLQAESGQLFPEDVEQLARWL